MIKALFFDIDGTLVPFGQPCPPQEVVEALAEVRQQGIKVFIATGRHKSWVVNLGALAVDGYVTVNGSMGLDADGTTVLFQQPMPADDIRRVVAFAQTHDMPLVFVPAEGDIFLTGINRDVTDTFQMLRLPQVPVRPATEALGRHIVQMMAFGTPEERTRSGLFTEVLKGSEATSWNPQFCDIVPRGSDKSIGMELMARHFGITLNQCVAFGDGNNDSSMIAAAGIGVAMGNAANDVKVAADYVTTAVDEGGVVKALRELKIKN